MDIPVSRFALPLGLLAGAIALPVAADEPLYAKNLGPVAGLLGLPSQRDAAPVAAGSLSAALHSAISNDYVLDSSTGEYLNLDGETLRFALELRYGLADNWDVQLEVPWLQHDGGNLDRVIDDWHDFWNMSDGGRSRAPRDQLDFTYATPEGGFSLLEDASGLGDISLSLTRAFYRDEDNDAVASLVLGYKFGSGDEDDFTGSGADDAFFALRFTGSHLSSLPLSWHGQAGYLRAGDSDIMGDRQEKDLWFAGLALDWRLAERWSLIGQLDSHASPMKSDIAALGDVAGMLTVGARWRFGRHWAADFSIVEDILVETAPDIIFQASVRYRSLP